MSAEWYLIAVHIESRDTYGRRFDSEYEWDPESLRYLEHRFSQAVFNVPPDNVLQRRY